MIIGLFVLQHICECYVQIELFQGHFELPEAVHKSVHLSVLITACLAL